MTARERPILFSAPMVRAILAGAKTQTRRGLRGFCPPNRPEYDSESGRLEWFIRDRDDVVVGMRCPYGMPGDRLWVRETWREWSDAAWHYAADLAVLPKLRDRDLANFLAQRSPFTWDSYKWRPSIFMPRAASRLTLEVTAVRVQRLEDISEDDAKSEGCMPTVESDGSVSCGTRKTEFRKLWESINGPNSWDANPWVWAISFKRLT